MLVAEPTFVGGKMIKNVDFWLKNEKMLESFCTYFRHVDLPN